MPNGLGIGILIEQLAYAVQRATYDDVLGGGELILIKSHGRNIHPGHISLKGKCTHPVMSSTRSAREAC
jgi:hypothetical protein